MGVNVMHTKIGKPHINPADWDFNDRLHFREEVSWQLPLPDGQILHRIDVYFDNEYLDNISIDSKQFKAMKDAGYLE
jgi:hypothetical protein